jgi:hypothetical protein
MVAVLAIRHVFPEFSVVYMNGVNAAAWFVAPTVVLLRAFFLRQISCHSSDVERRRLHRFCENRCGAQRRLVAIRMKGQSEVLNPRQIFVSTNPVPSRPVAVLSVLAHLAVLAGIVVLVQMPRSRVVEQKYTVTSISSISVAPRLSFSPTTAKGGSRRLGVPRVHRNPRMEFVPVGATEGKASKKVLERARKASAAMVRDLQRRYGFSLGGYELPAWVSGDLPSLPAAEFPSQIEQFVIVEITIDADGSVVQAKLVTGSVTPSVEHRLFSAILGFKYKPASRDGTPIPSQLDLVVHVPS